MIRSGVWSLLAQCMFCLVASGQDHLEPEESSLGQFDSEFDYARQIRGTLLEDSADYYIARMICFPTLGPEWVVTVVRVNAKGLDSPDSYYVESVKFDRKLFRYEGADRPRVGRSRATFDRETAESLNRIWRRMLRSPRYPAEPRIGADGVDYHFSRALAFIHHGQSDPLGGFEQGRIWTPEDDSRCGALVEIGERLRAYAESKPDQREKLRSEIRGLLEKLERRLDIHKPSR